MEFRRVLFRSIGNEAEEVAAEKQEDEQLQVEAADEIAEKNRKPVKNGDEEGNAGADDAIAGQIEDDHGVAHGAALAQGENNDAKNIADADDDAKVTDDESGARDPFNGEEQNR